MIGFLRACAGILAVLSVLTAAGTNGHAAGALAVGNCAASPVGEGYAGGGASIGPNLVFGFRAGLHAAARAARG